MPKSNEMGGRSGSCWKEQIIYEECEQSANLSSNSYRCIRRIEFQKTTPTKAKSVIVGSKLKTSTKHKRLPHTATIEHSTMISIQMTWGHMIWVFLPLPLISLLLLTILPQSFGTRLVQKIFFTRISIGPWHTRLVWVFVGASLIIFSMAARTIQMGFASAHVPCSG